MQDHITQDHITDESLRDHIHHESFTESHLEFKANPPSTKRLGVVLVCVALLTGLGYVGIHTMSSKQPQKTSGRSAGRGRQMTPLVTVTKAFQKTVPVQLQAIGNVQAESTVSVTPQVGFIFAAMSPSAERCLAVSSKAHLDATELDGLAGPSGTSTSGPSPVDGRKCDQSSAGPIVTI